MGKKPGAEITGELAKRRAEEGAHRFEAFHQHQVFAKIGDEIRARREARAAGRKREGRSDSIDADFYEWRSTMMTARTRKNTRAAKWTRKDRARWRIQWGWKRARTKEAQLKLREKRRMEFAMKEAQKAGDLPRKKLAKEKPLTR